MSYFILFTIAVLAYLPKGQTNNCIQREYESGIVCVCNATFCDTLPSVGNLYSGYYKLFTSNKDGLRFEENSGTFSNNSKIGSHYVTVDRSKYYQTILGYGGAFTDAAGLNIASLSESTQRNLLDTYFSESGSEYTLCRVPLAGTDFSTRGYTYADDGNGTLDAFSLQDEDYIYKIPYINEAYNISNGKLRLFASAWSAPPWSKTSGDYRGGFVHEEYYQLWAEYYIKFFEAYRENGIEFWGVTTQNEPATGLVGGINSNGFVPSQLKQFLKENLGPTIRNSTFSETKIIIHDDQTPLLIQVPQYFDDDDARVYIDGVGVHWYADIIAFDLYSLAQSSKKDTFALVTEACTGYFAVFGLEKPVLLGSWDRAYYYIESLLRYSNKNYSGWIDWNLVLDLEGGPNWVDNNVDSPIVVNATADEFYKQPMYYAIAHVSKYVPPGSVRIDTSISLAASFAGIQSTGFLRPDGAVVLIIHNSNGESRDLVISDGYSGYTTLNLSANSINTLIYI